MSGANPVGHMQWVGQEIPMGISCSCSGAYTGVPRKLNMQDKPLGHTGLTTSAVVLGQCILDCTQPMAR